MLNDCFQPVGASALRRKLPLANDRVSKVYFSNLNLGLQALCDDPQENQQNHIDEIQNIKLLVAIGETNGAETFFLEAR